MSAVPLTRFILRRMAKPHGPVGLMYHSVRPGSEKPEWSWAVSRQQFSEQLDLLADEGYLTPTLNELSSSSRSWPERTALITFDDGYADNLDACAELYKRGMRATWFIVSGSLGQAPRWAEDGRPAGRLLNATELREMHSAGMEIGSHSVNHVRLNAVDDTRLMQELVDSKATLEDLLGSAVNSFAYPYGAYDERCTNAAKQAGYAAACTTQTGWALRDNDPYRLRRLTVFNHDMLSRFARKITFASHAVGWADLLRYTQQRARSRFM